MKRLLQIVATVVAGLLVVQPALAELACTAAMQCSMGMSATGTACPMGRPLAAGDCSQDCCGHMLPAANPSWAMLAKPKVQSVPACFTSVVAVAGTESGRAAISLEPVVFSSPPRYLLLQVFRI
jgi:hypothetical protein